MPTPIAWDSLSAIRFTSARRGRENRFAFLREFTQKWEPGQSFDFTAEYRKVTSQDGTSLYDHLRTVAAAMAAGAKPKPKAWNALQSARRSIEALVRETHKDDTLQVLQRIDATDATKPTIGLMLRRTKTESGAENAEE